MVGSSEAVCPIGPIRIGAAYSVPVVSRTITVHGIANVTALAVARVDAARGTGPELETRPGIADPHSRDEAECFHSGRWFLSPRRCSCFPGVRARHQ